jgi:hypothetical protein
MKSLGKYSFVPDLLDTGCYCLQNERSTGARSRSQERGNAPGPRSLANPLAASIIQSLLPYEGQKTHYDAVAERTVSKECETLDLQARRALRFHLDATRRRRH